MEYFDDGRWFTSADDQCTVLQASRLGVEPDTWSGLLDETMTSALLPVSLNQGEGDILHAAPGALNIGSVRYQYQAASWLLIENDGDGDYQDWPVGEVSFGQFRGNDRVIYWREQSR